MGLFGFGSKNNTSVDEWTDKKLLKEIDRPDRDIVSGGRLVEEAERRGLTNPKTGKTFRTK